ncbi:hypothetical protein GALMADRAFT_209451 [Galerina marginata CBS 339.88]|uniref:Uncharacterized protein n=1 Tax=Galerina marginata (strain CBS 339.88) TaxID=685588 RepID=A0A067T4E8_GALM3|nr:hypothetical protein GALMADRAFT_209451 [Galerina marginata CBS 339.88]
MLFSTYHAVQDLTASVTDPKNPNSPSGFSELKEIMYLHKLLASGTDFAAVSSTCSATMAGSTFEMIRDENAFLILLRYCRTVPSQDIALHLAELHIRLMNSFYPKTPLPLVLDTQHIADFWTNWILSSIYTEGFLSKLSSPIPAQAISFQLSLAVESFFKTAANPDVDDETLLNSTYTSPFGALLRYGLLPENWDFPAVETFQHYGGISRKGDPRI